MLNPIDYSISKFSTFADEVTIRNISDRGQSLIFNKGSIICVRGEPTDCIYYIVDGLVQIGIDRADGSRFNLIRLGAGHTFGEMAVILRQPVIHDIRAISNVSLIRLERREIEKLMLSNIVFTESLLKVAYLRLQTTLSQFGDSLTASLETRTAKLIYSILNSNEHDGDYIHCRQVDLAHGLGVSRVSIGKALKGLVARNLIELGYSRIEIVSLADLRSFIENSNHLP